MRVNARIGPDRIKAAFAQRLAAQQAAQRHPSAAHHAIFAHGNRRVLRACGLKPACAGNSAHAVQQWRKRVLVRAMKRGDGTLAALIPAALFRTAAPCRVSPRQKRRPSRPRAPARKIPCRGQACADAGLVGKPRQQGQINPRGLAHAPFNAVALDSVAEHPTGGESDAWPRIGWRQLIGCAQADKVAHRRRELFAPAL